MGTEPKPLTVAQAILERFEDSDEPITAVQDLGARLADAQADIDPELEDPAVSMAIAATLYLAHRRDMDADDDALLRAAARSEWKGDPPDAVVDWLAGQGVRI